MFNVRVQRWVKKTHIIFLTQKCSEPRKGNGWFWQLFVQMFCGGIDSHRMKHRQPSRAPPHVWIWMIGKLSLFIPAKNNWARSPSLTQQALMETQAPSAAQEALHQPKVLPNDWTGYAPWNYPNISWRRKQKPLLFGVGNFRNIFKWNSCHDMMHCGCANWWWLTLKMAKLLKPATSKQL